jgi:SCY1-like protein 1
MGNANSLSLPYDIISEIDNYSGNDHWVLSSGTKKDDSIIDKRQLVQVSIFKFAKTQSAKLAPAQRNWQKMRTMKHPYILTFLDGADLEDSLVLVTEQCIPLEKWLKNSQIEYENNNNDKQPLIQELLWGFRCILNALMFLHFNCSLSHGFLGLHSIFVCNSGDWKIGSLDLACNLKNDDDISFARTHCHLLQKPYIPPERLQSSWDASVPIGSADIYSLGQCMQKSFNLVDLDIPVEFSKYLQKMISMEAKRRPSSSQLSKLPIFNSDHINLLLSLGELSIKPANESIQILGQVASQIQNIPKSVCIYKILPSVAKSLRMAINDFSNRDSRESCRQSVQQSMALMRELALQEKLDEVVFMNQCGDLLGQLWTMSDRAVRMALLKSLKATVLYISPDTVNKFIFDPMIAGFADSNAKMREDTLKNLVHVVDKLDEKNMQDKLVRCITNLQNDKEPSIRTNATIFLGRIAVHLNESVRNKCLALVFGKAMRDNFMHCRVAGLRAAQACISLIDPAQLSGKIMPQVCSLLLDRSSEIRELSLNFMNSAVQVMRTKHNALVSSEKAAEKLSEKSRPSNEKSLSSSSSSNNDCGNQGVVRGGGGGENSSSWSSWAVDGLAKTLVSAASESPNNPKSTSNSDPNLYIYNTSVSTPKTSKNEYKANNVSSPSLSRDRNMSMLSIESTGDGDAWDMDGDWDMDENNKGQESPATKKVSSLLNMDVSDDVGGGDWGDDDFDLGFDDDKEVKVIDEKVIEKKVIGKKGSLSSVKKSSANELADPFAAISLKPNNGISSSSSTSSTTRIGGLGTSSSTKKTFVKKVAVKKLAKSDAHENWEDF